MLFTDIEGSTRLLDHLGEDAYARAIADHHALLREVFLRRRGREVDTQGDAFFVVFRDAGDAVAATLDGQRALATHDWPEGQMLRVRMGLHTGAIRRTSTGYIGLAVHAAARIASAAHGGQVLLSSATARAVEGKLPADCRLIDLDEHRLKDLSTAERIWQLDHPDIEAEHPPIRTLTVLPHNLPIQLTRFIGRELELTAVSTMLEAHRLTTLTGPGGTGKTRLALQAAAESVDRFRNGVWLTELSELADPALVAAAVARSLGARTEPGRELIDSLIDFLSPREAMLILDNCEHVIESVSALVDRMLHACENVTVVATSREALHISGEAVYPVPTMTSPELGPEVHPEAIIAVDAVALFCDRAVLVDPAFRLDAKNAAAIAEICRTLDGIPLAVELAAARTRTLSAQQIEARLSDRFALLTTGPREAATRQRTLRAAIDWSHDLLSTAERVAFARLSVFTGFSLEAAEAVCGRGPIAASVVMDLLERLVDQSLVAVNTEGDEARYRMLDTLQAFAWEKLCTSGDADEPGATLDRMVDWCSVTAATSDSDDAKELNEQLDLLETELPNFRRALEHAIRTRADVALDLASSLGPLWRMRGYHAEGRRWLDGALDASDHQGASRALALRRSGQLAFAMGDYARAHELYLDALLISRSASAEDVEADVLLLLGNLARATGETAEARARYDEAEQLARARNDESRLATARNGSALIALNEGKFDVAEAIFLENLKIREHLGEDIEAAITLNNLAELARMRSDYDRARDLNDRCLAIGRRVRDPEMIGRSLANLGAIAFFQGDYETTSDLWEESLQLHREMQFEVGVAQQLNNLANLESVRGDLAVARAHFEEALEIVRKMGDARGTRTVLINLGHILRQSAESASAVGLYEEALGLARPAEDAADITGALLGLTAASLDTGEVGRAVAYLRDGLRTIGDLQMPKQVAALLEGAAQVALAISAPLAAVKLIGAAQAIRFDSGNPPNPSESRETEAIIANAEEVIGPDATSHGLGRGRGMSTRDAIELVQEIVAD